MLRFRKWKIFPPIFSNAGKVIDEITVTGKLKINDIDEVNVNQPQNDQLLVYNQTYDKWENQDQGAPPPPPVTALCDEIRMFGGDVNTVFPIGVGTGDYAGWYLCNGTNGTLDLRSRFVLGHDPSHFPTIGGTGGEDEVTLTGAESGTSIHNHFPGTLNITSSGSHNHKNGYTMNAMVEGGNVPKQAYYGTDGSSEIARTHSAIITDASHTHPSSSFAGATAVTGGSDATEAHNNMPPYVVVAFIQYKNCTS